MSSSNFQLLSTTAFYGPEKLAEYLQFSDSPVTELSAQGWTDLEIVMDELSSFFSFSRSFKRDWESIQTCLEELSTKGRLIVVGGIEQDSLENLGLFVDAVVGAALKTQTNVAVVLQGFTANTLNGKEAVHTVTPYTPPAQEEGEASSSSSSSTYRLQISGKRNHTYYVNLTLKVFQRRPWYNSLELSGLGNAIPSIVSIAEILKRYQVAKVKNIETSLVDLSEGDARSLQKAKMVVLLDKTASVPAITDEDEIGEQVV